MTGRAEFVFFFGSRTPIATESRGRLQRAQRLGRSLLSQLREELVQLDERVELMMRACAHKPSTMSQFAGFRYRDITRRLKSPEAPSKNHRPPAKAQQSDIWPDVSLQQN